MDGVELRSEQEQTGLRLSDLLGAEVVDGAGTRLGAVRDVRLVQDGPVLGVFGAALRVDGLVVGHWSFAGRLGFDRKEMRGPAVVAWPVRRLYRHARYVPWERVAAVAPARLTIRGTGDDLGPPP